jgi:hypothetical protein
MIRIYLFNNLNKRYSPALRNLRMASKIFAFYKENNINQKLFSRLIDVISNKF